MIQILSGEWLLLLSKQCVPIKKTYRKKSFELWLLILAIYLFCNTIVIKYQPSSEASVYRCLKKEIFFKFVLNSQENTCREETPAQMFYCDFFRNFSRTPFFIEHFRRLLLVLFVLYYVFEIVREKLETSEC